MPLEQSKSKEAAGNKKKDSTHTSQGDFMKMSSRDKRDHIMQKMTKDKLEFHHSRKK